MGDIVKPLSKGASSAPPLTVQLLLSLLQFLPVKTPKVGTSHMTIMRSC